MPPGPQDIPDDAFRRRALAEAARYGSDPLVFVRELLQNARDAGARRVQIATSREGSLERVTCRDDGCGMTYEHARRYLFALYASSKEGSRDEAGKFGIGFWSVLRFSPSTITIRSWAEGDAWQVTVGGDLERVTTSRPGVPGGGRDAGTEVVLERPSSRGLDLSAEVLEAARRYGRYLTLRDDPDQPLEVRVDGQAIHAELALPAPSAAFRGRGFRGVVGLGAQPEVELFAQGLFVRSASSLQELRDAGALPDHDGARDALAELPSLAPRVLIDSAELDLLLARSDARDDRHLRRILSAAEKALGRLITRHLQALRPQPWHRLLWGRLRDTLETHLAGWKGGARRLATAALAGVVVGSAAAWWLTAAGLGGAGRSRPAQARETSARPSDGHAGPEDDLAILTGSVVDGRVPQAGAPPGERPAGRQPPLPPRSATTLPFYRYVDLASSYRGPRPGSFAGDRSRLAMVYRSAETTPFFTALVIDDPEGSRWAESPAGWGELPRYRTAECRRGCTEVRLLVAEDQRTLRLPVPTGHRLDAASVRLDSRALAVLETASDEALVRLPNPPYGVLEYRTGPASAPPAPRTASPRAPLPGELAALAEELRHLPIDKRAQEGLAAVARRVRYDRSPALARSYQQARRAGAGFVEAALDLGAGDCDVQNGVLAALLRAAGVDARLAVGYVGIGGTVAPGLHAWVEYADDLGQRHVADASVVSGAEDFGSPALVAERPSTSAGGDQTPGLAAGLTPRSSSATPALVAVLLAAIASALVVRRRRTATGLAAGGLAPGEDLAALLGGALRHPEAFAGLPALLHGRFVPLAGRTGAISLARARRLARGSRLFRSGAGSRLARRAAARGVEVVDASTAEGRVLSLALGAIDLDRWSSWLERSSESGLTRRINRRLGALRAPWRLRDGARREASGAAPSQEPWMEIALEDLGLGDRQILLNLEAPELAPARALLPERPAAAAFAVLDVLLHRLDLEERVRARILAAFAREAVAEAAEARGA